MIALGVPEEWLFVQHDASLFMSLTPKEEVVPVVEEVDPSDVGEDERARLAFAEAQLSDQCVEKLSVFLNTNKASKRLSFHPLCAAIGKAVDASGLDAAKSTCECVQFIGELIFNHIDCSWLRYVRCGLDVVKTHKSTSLAQGMDRIFAASLIMFCSPVLCSFSSVHCVQCRPLSNWVSGSHLELVLRRDNTCN